MPRVLRALAIVIALVAAIDPAVTSHRRVKPEIAVVAGDAARDSALAERVARELARRYTIVRAPFARAAATVIAGNTLPASAYDLAAPVFGVLHDGGETSIAIEHVRSATRAPRDARVPVNAVVHVRGARGRTLDATLRMGDLVVDRVSRTIESDTARLTVPLAFVPTATGAAPLRVSAELGDARSHADIVVNVDDRRLGILFFDRRPSWMSTFVRRALERDARFVVTSRIVTSREITTDAGRPPRSLADLAPLAQYDAVVIGAPEALTARDVDGLDAFMRRRGGAVVLLFDNRAPGAYERLTNVAAWSETPDGTRASAIVGGPDGADSTGLRSGELAWPAQLPPGARTFANASGRPVVWTSAAGAGTLVVSGMQDAWKFRNAAFDSFWQATIGDAAGAAPAMVDVVADESIVSPGSLTAITVTMRDGALARDARDLPVRATVSATLEAGAARTPVHVLPDGALGRFRGIIRAPDSPGSYRIVVTANGARAEMPVVVAPNVARASREANDLVTAFAQSRGGTTASASALSSIANELDRALQRTVRRETWYPMRSALWIVPFAVLLGAEWWWRRRRGYA